MRLSTKIEEKRGERPMVHWVLAVVIAALSSLAAVILYDKFYKYATTIGPVKTGFGATLVGLLSLAGFLYFPTTDWLFYLSYAWLWPSMVIIYKTIVPEIRTAGSPQRRSGLDSEN